jgi:hypothetical protein
MTATDAATEQPTVLQDTWVLLDEASQILLRAEAIVALLGLESDAAQSHSYAADVAGDLLGTLKSKLAEAQQMLRPTRGRRSGGIARRR